MRAAVARVDVRHAGELVDPILLARLVAVLAPRDRRAAHLVHRRDVDRSARPCPGIVCAVRRRHEAVVDALHLRRAIHHVRREIVDQDARRLRGAGEDHLARHRAAERAAAPDQRAGLREDVGGLAVDDRHLLVARLVQLRQLAGRVGGGDDLDGRVARVHRVHRGVLEHVRRAAAVHRLDEHEPAEPRAVGRHADDHARLVRLAVGRAADVGIPSPWYL